MLIEYTEGSSFIHRLDVRTKSLAFLVIVVAAFVFSNPVYNLLVLLICVYPGLMIRLPFGHVNRLLRPLIPVFILIILFASFSYQPESFSRPYARKILFSVTSGGYMTCTVGGILFGLSLSLRIITMVIASTIFTMTTPIDDLLYLLRKLRVSYKFGFVLSTGLRFIPTMEKKANQIIEAQRSRGARFRQGNMIRRIMAYIPVMVPMIVESLRMSENLAMAMVNRGFGATKNWSVVDELQPRPADYWLSVLLSLVMAGVIYLRLLGFGKL
jgi:energy-coupling factor transport system permease protein